MRGIAFCEMCDKWVDIEVFQLGADATLVLKLKCGHRIHPKFTKEENAEPKT